MAPPLNLNDPRHVTATIVFIVEIILICLIILARLNIKRLKIGNHHKYVYSSVLVNLIIILTWMLPGELRLLDRIIQGRTDPLSVWYLLIHATFGSIAILLGIFICLIFFLKVIRQELIPLGLIRRMKPLMITTFVCWSVAFFFGFLIYFNNYIVRFL
jgi:hypothetical protein